MALRGRSIIRAGELQRMFSGDYIEHQELNPTDEPHYQQPAKEVLPRYTVGDAEVVTLIGDGSPMEQHMLGRLTATTIPAGGQTTIENPLPGEDLFLYVTDGRGTFGTDDKAVGQYDVMLATTHAEAVEIRAGDDDLHFMSFYLPPFL